MFQRQCRGVKKIPGQAEACVFLGSIAKLAASSIQHVTYNRMSKRGQVYTNLVSPPRIDLDFQQGELPVWRIQPPLNRVMTDGLTASLAPGGHASAPYPVPADAAVDGSAIALQPALHQGNVLFLDLPAGELGSEAAMRFVALGYYNKTAGGLVQTMHDSRAQLAADGR